MIEHRTGASETVTDSGSEVREPVMKEQVPDAPPQDHEKAGGAASGATTGLDKKRKGKAVVTATEERHE